MRPSTPIPSRLPAVVLAFGPAWVLRARVCVASAFTSLGRWRGKGVWWAPCPCSLGWTLESDLLLALLPGTGREVDVFPVVRPSTLVCYLFCSREIMLYL